MVSLLRDITKRKRAAAQVQAALDEKVVLLREVHHRVKNILQAMIALMDMRMSKEPNDEAGGFIRELKEQTRTMSLVYEQLYQSENLARVAMAPYLEKLSANVFEAFGGGRAIELQLDVATLVLDVSQAMPCGLIVNELLTNSLKHAFPEGFGKPPRVSIALGQEGKTCRLVVSDNGVGLPPAMTAGGAVRSDFVLCVCGPRISSGESLKSGAKTARRSGSRLRPSRGCLHDEVPHSDCRR